MLTSWYKYLQNLPVFFIPRDLASLISSPPHKSMGHRHRGAAVTNSILSSASRHEIYEGVRAGFWRCVGLQLVCDLFEVMIDLWGERGGSKIFSRASVWKKNLVCLSGNNTTFTWYKKTSRNSKTSKSYYRKMRINFIERLFSNAFPQPNPNYSVIRILCVVRLTSD